MRKKIFALTLSAAIMCLVLSACTENGTYSADIENAQDMAITEGITVSAEGYSFEDGTLSVDVAITNTSDETLEIVIEKVMLNGLTDIEIGTVITAEANSTTEATVTFELDRSPSTITSADIYVITGNDGDVYHLELE